jgi:hypothetical protein
LAWIRQAHWRQEMRVWGPAGGLYCLPMKKAYSVLGDKAFLKLSFLLKPERISCKTFARDIFLYSRCACWISSIQDIANSLVIFLRIDFFVPFNASIAIVWAFLLRALSTPPRMHFVTMALISVGIFSQV